MKKEQTNKTKKLVFLDWDWVGEKWVLMSWEITSSKKRESLEGIGITVGPMAPGNGFFEWWKWVKSRLGFEEVYIGEERHDVVAPRICIYNYIHIYFYLNAKTKVTLKKQKIKNGGRSAFCGLLSFFDSRKQSERDHTVFLNRLKKLFVIFEVICLKIGDLKVFNFTYLEKYILKIKTGYCNI